MKETNEECMNKILSGKGYEENEQDHVKKSGSGLGKKNITKEVMFEHMEAI